MSDIIIESLGYLASTLVFVAFYMKTMIPLRCVAILSNVAFVSYGAWLELWPIVILHSLMLPLNTIRLIQIRQMLKEIRAAHTQIVDISTLARSFELVKYRQGTVLFLKGDVGDCAYYVAKGKVELPEVSAVQYRRPFRGNSYILHRARPYGLGYLCDGRRPLPDRRARDPSRVSPKRAFCFLDIETSDDPATRKYHEARTH